MIAQLAVNQGVYLRSGPSANYAAIAIAVPTDYLVVWGKQQNGYSEIQCGDIRGWIPSARLREFGHALPGIHAGADWTLQLPHTYDMITTAKLQAATVLCQGSIGATEIDRLREHGAKLIHARLYNKDMPKSAVQYLTEIEETIARLYDAGVTLFSFHNEPNLAQEGMWVQGAWQNGAEFGAWFLEGVNYLAGRYPLMRIGFPAMSPGHAIAGTRYPADQFMAKASEAVDAADWLCQHSYFGYGITWAQTLQDISAFAKRYPKLIIVSEWSCPDPSIPKERKGEDYGMLLRSAPVTSPANVLALTSFVAQDENFEPEQWYNSPIPGIVGTYL